MNRKALFFDIDGTLLSEVTHQIPASAVQAISRARSAGHLAFINTGRCRAQLRDIENMLEMDGYVCGCGTYVEVHREQIYHRSMTEEQSILIRRAIEECDVFGILEGMDGCYMMEEYSRFPIAEKLKEAVGYALRSCDWQNDRISFDKFCVVCDEKSSKAAFFRRLGLDIDVIDRGSNFYECVPAGHSKATGIQVVLDRYGILLEDAYVFGDSTNDLSMFEYASNAVLMGKHDKELELYASFLTKTVEHDGIAYAMRRLGIIE